MHRHWLAVGLNKLLRHVAVHCSQAIAITEQCSQIDLGVSWGRIACRVEVRRWGLEGRLRVKQRRFQKVAIFIVLVSARRIEVGELC